jgi:phospholipase C
MGRVVSPKSSAGFACGLASLLAASLSLILTGCGGSSSTTTPPPPHTSYSVSATALSPSAINTGNSATSTISVTPANAYTGQVTLSCSSITGGGTPAPVCAFSKNPVAVTSAAAGNSTLTVSTNFGTPAATYTVQVSAADALGSAPTNGPLTLQLATTASIQHVVVIFQENRTPDNLFQDPNLIKAGADIVLSGVNSKGAIIPLTPIDLSSTTSNPDLYDLDHSHSAFTKMCDFDSTSGTCKMDGADLISVFCGGAANCPPANPQFKYVNPADVQPYFAMAEQYTFGDHMFQTNQGPSFPAHQFLISATSAPSPGSNLFVENNPVKPKSDNTGCIAPPTQTVTVIDPNGIETTQYPCFEHQTLTDLLNAQGISWRYYANSAGTIWTAPNAIQHMCVPNVQPPNATSCTGSDWTNNVVLEYTRVLTDIANNQLAQVSWVTPNGLQSDHAQSTDGTGPSWVASVVNAIGNSPYWANTAIFITWDDWGGWYDHVPPKIINSYEYGFRVPLIVVSPYARAQYISHNTHDFGSMLKFTEETFGLQSLGYADAAADDFADCFDFTQTPLKFQTINAPLKAAFFLNDTKPPTDPDDD